MANDGMILLLTVPGFVVISPALLMIALLIKFRLGNPVLFKQFLREEIAAAGGGR